MHKRLNKETVLFLLGVAFALWAVFKLGLYLGQRPDRVATPKIAATDIRSGDPHLRDSLPIPPLDHYTNRRGIDPFGHLPEAVQLFVRSVTTHRLTDAEAETHCRLECRMFPDPLRTLRFRLPSGARDVGVSSYQIHHGQAGSRTEGNVLILYVEPDRLNRDDYRCEIDLRFTTPLASHWRVPVVAWAGERPPASSESGDLAVFLARGATIQATPLDLNLARDGLAPLQREGALLACHFKRPDFRIALHIVHPRPPDDRDRRDGGGDADGDDDIVNRDGDDDGDDGHDDGDGNRVVIGPPPTDLPLQLTMVVVTEGPDQRPQAVLRHRQTGELLRGREGDTLYDGIRIRSISDNAVIITDDDGLPHVFYGRFRDL